MTFSLTTDGSGYNRNLPVQLYSFTLQRVTGKSVGIGCIGAVKYKALASKPRMVLTTLPAFPRINIIVFMVPMKDDCRVISNVVAHGAINFFWLSEHKANITPLGRVFNMYFNLIPEMETASFNISTPRSP